MFEISVRSRFSAAHRIDDYPGSCAELHGHNWTAELCLGIESMNGMGMAFDFREAKSILHQIVSCLDHTFLNDNPILGGENPTAERIAVIIFDAATEKAPNNVKVLSVTVWESDDTSVTYRNNR